MGYQNILYVDIYNSQNLNKTHEAPMSPLLSRDCGNSTFAVPGPSARPIPPRLADTEGCWSLVQPVQTPSSAVGVVAAGVGVGVAGGAAGGVVVAAAAVAAGVAAGADIPGPPRVAVQR